jgi:hypothetical protein
MSGFVNPQDRELEHIFEPWYVIQHSDCKYVFTSCLWTFDLMLMQSWKHFLFAITHTSWQSSSNGHHHTLETFRSNSQHIWSTQNCTYIIVNISATVPASFITNLASEHWFWCQFFELLWMTSVKWCFCESWWLLIFIRRHWHEWTMWSYQLSSWPQQEHTHFSSRGYLIQPAVVQSLSKQW